MPELLTRKPQIREIIDRCLEEYPSGIPTFSKALHETLLEKKARFPLLEYAAQLLLDKIEETDQVPLCQKICAGHSIGGNVIIGIILQQRMVENFEESVIEAKQFIAEEATWYGCDIIGERVFGVALLRWPEKMLPELQKMSASENQWIGRTIGPGCHYAIKKGLDALYVSQVFQLLLSMATVKDKEVKQGIGWAAKTTAKFHPLIIEQFRSEIDNPDHVGQWFRAKVKIGLERNAHMRSKTT